MTQPAPSGWLLDTNIIVHILRGSPLGRYLVDAQQLRARPDVSLISVVIVGEIMSLSRQFGWGPQKVQLMRELLGELIIVDINSGPVLDAYADIDVWAHQNGVVMGKNDLWIAATASATNSLLLTTDRDFDSLHGRFLQRGYYDPDGTYPPPA